jgi:hypothetical protein
MAMMRRLDFSKKNLYQRKKLAGCLPGNLLLNRVQTRVIYLLRGVAQFLKKII